jgi:membrane-associated phospholipid phosphatase
MTSSHGPEPVEERLAGRLSTWQVRARPSRAVQLLRRLGRLDRAAYCAVAEMSTPRLDGPLRRVSDFANFSKPWFLVAGVLALFGGPQGRRAGLTGVTAIGVTSFVANQPMKLVGERRRPDRTQLGIPERRWVQMPSTTSFPSGHSASAAAFAVSVGEVVPGLKLPLRAAAAVVAFSRIYTGVHYPGDVVAGAAVGALVGWATSAAVRRLRRDPSLRRSSPSGWLR